MNFSYQNNVVVIRIIYDLYPVAVGWCWYIPNKQITMPSNGNDHNDELNALHKLPLVIPVLM